MRLGVLLVAVEGREAEGDGDGKAAPRHDAGCVAAADGGSAVEWIGTGSSGRGAGTAVARNQWRYGCSREREALNVVRVEQVGCGQPDLGPVEDGVTFEVSGQRRFDFGLSDLADRAAEVLALSGASVTTDASAPAPAPPAGAYDWFSSGLAQEALPDAPGLDHRLDAQQPVGDLRLGHLLGTIFYLQRRNRAAQGQLSREATALTQCRSVGRSTKKEKC